MLNLLSHQRAQPLLQTIVWYETRYNVLMFRQANGRIRRIGSDLASQIEIYVPVMAVPADEIAFGLVARKLVASLQFEARDLTSALDAAGASAADTDAALQQQARARMGQAILDLLEGQAALESPCPRCRSRWPSPARRGNAPGRGGASLQGRV